MFLTDEATGPVTARGLARLFQFALDRRNAKMAAPVRA